MRKILTAAALTTLAFTGPGQAASTTANITLQATLLKACTASATSINFGNYTPGSGALTGNSTISVKCTKSTPYTVALNAGTTTGASLTQRLLAYGAETLQYNLYTSNTFATVFGDGTLSTGTSAGTGTGLGAVAQTYTAYGRLLDNATNQNAAPNAAATNYSDTVVVTVTY